MLDIESFAGRLDTDQESAIDALRADALVSATDPTPNDNRLAFCHHFDDLHLPIRERSKNVLQVVDQRLLASDDAFCTLLPSSQVVAYIRRKQFGGLLPVTTIHKFEVPAHYLPVSLRLTGSLCDQKRRVAHSREHDEKCCQTSNGSHNGSLLWRPNDGDQRARGEHWNLYEH